MTQKQDTLLSMAVLAMACGLLASALAGSPPAVLVFAVVQLTLTSILIVSGIRARRRERRDIREGGRK